MIISKENYEVKGMVKNLKIFNFIYIRCEIKGLRDRIVVVLVVSCWL